MPPPSLPLILDCDTGEDDAIAIVLSVMAGLPLKYIVTCHGNTSLDNATRNSSRILSLLDAKNIKVIKGAAKPLEVHKLEGPDFMCGEDFLGKNGICNIELPESKYDNILDFGDDRYIEELVKRIKTEGPVDYIITGPCTNFARLCEYFGNDIKKYINSLTIMGGAVYVRGTRGAGIKNTSFERDKTDVPESWAEFNFYCDPKAIKMTLEAGLNPTVVTWDTCINFEVEMDYINQMKSEKVGGKFVIELMKAFMNLFGLKNKTHFELCDPLTIMAFMEHGKTIDDRINIITEKEYFGKSYPDGKGSPIRYYYSKKEEIEGIISEMMKKCGITI